MKSDSESPPKKSRESTPDTTSGEEDLLGGRPAKKSRVSLGGGGILAPDQRGRTAVGPQVEHASAYVLFEELIYSTLEGTKIAKAPAKLAEVFSCLPLSEDTIQQIEKKAEEAKEFISREERKKTTKTLRGANYLAEESELLKQLIQEKLDDPTTTGDKRQSLEKMIMGAERVATTDNGLVKNSMKFANRANFSSVVAGIMDDCIFGANKMAYVSLPTEGVPSNPNTGKEKQAKDNLKLLSDFIADVKKAELLILDPSSEKQQKGKEKREELKQDQKLIKKLEEKWGIKTDQIIKLIEGSEPIDNIFDKVKDKISEHISQLFYYPRIDPTKLPIENSDE